MRDWIKAEGVRKQWEKYKYAVLVVLIGAGLLLWPSGGGDTKEKVIPEEARNIQAEMEEILGKISGVGEVRVMLTEDTDGERRLARNMEVSGSPADSAHYSQSTEAVMEDSGGEKPSDPMKLYRDAAAKELTARWGRKVSITMGPKKGRLEFEFYNDEDLTALLDRLEETLKGGSPL